MESLNHGACPRCQQDSLSLYLLLGHGCGRVPDRRLREERLESTSQFLGVSVHHGRGCGRESCLAVDQEEERNGGWAMTFSTVPIDPLLPGRPEASLAGTPTLGRSTPLGSCVYRLQSTAHLFGVLQLSGLLKSAPISLQPRSPSIIMSPL